MIERIGKSFREGVSRLRWFSSLFSERLRVELNVIKLLNESRELEQKRDDIAKAAGQRVFELRNQDGVNVFEDTRVRDKMKEMEGLEEKIEEIRVKVSDISAGGID